MTLILSCWLAGAALAHPNHGDEGHIMPSPTPPPAQPEVEVPESYAQVVQDLTTQSDAAGKALQRKRIADLYASCDALTELLKALPSLAEDEPDASKKVTEAVPALERAVGEMRKQATQGSFSSATEALASFQTALEPLKPAVE